MRLNIVAALREWTQGRYSKERRHPYWLSEDEIAGIYAIRASDGWQPFCTLIDTLVNLKAEEMLRTSDPSDLQFHRGYIVGLREAVRAVEETVKREEHARKVKHDATGSTADRRREHERASLYATPGWHPST